MSYDAKCHTLALAFLSDFQDAALPHPRAKLADELAQQIQDAVEGFIEAEISGAVKWPFP